MDRNDNKNQTVTMTACYRDTWLVSPDFKGTLPHGVKPGDTITVEDLDRWRRYPPILGKVWS